MIEVRFLRPPHIFWMDDIFSHPIYTEAEMAGKKSDCSMACRWLLERLGPLRVIEIGTSYGYQLPSFVPISEETVCIDPMYDWVPDVRVADGFDPERTDQKKLSTWEENVSPFREKVRLVLGNSHMVHEQLSVGPMDVLIVDGCHSPSDQVADDYLNYRKFMRPEHIVIWDDMDIPDVRDAVKIVKDRLDSESIGYECLDFYYALIMRVRTPPK